jgi:phosphoribosylanthranilate isomerase
MQVKVCGITRTEDAVLCCRLGVQALGFNFYPKSSRYISPKRARRIGEALSPFVMRVGIFVNEGDVEKVWRDFEEAKMDAFQFHGDEDLQYCAQFDRLSVFKAIRVGGRIPPPEELDEFPIRAFLLDSFHPDKYGGTGMTADWKLAAGFARKYPTILSGGLNAGNVVEAVRKVRPLAVDVCSGVEAAPGIKDPEKLRAFMRVLRECEENVP